MCIRNSYRQQKWLNFSSHCFPVVDLSTHFLSRWMNLMYYTTSVLLLMATQIYEQWNRQSYKNMRPYSMAGWVCVRVCTMHIVCYINVYVYTEWMELYGCVYCRFSVLSDATLPLALPPALPSCSLAPSALSHNPAFPLSICMFSFFSLSNVWCCCYFCFTVVSFYPGFCYHRRIDSIVYTTFCIRIMCMCECVCVCFFFFKNCWFVGKFSSSVQINHGLCYGSWIHDRFVSCAKIKNKIRKLAPNNRSSFELLRGDTGSTVCTRRMHGRVYARKTINRDLCYLLKIEHCSPWIFCGLQCCCWWWWSFSFLLLTLKILSVLLLLFRLPWPRELSSSVSHLLFQSDFVFDRITGNDCDEEHGYV